MSCGKHRVDAHCDECGADLSQELRAQLAAAEKERADADDIYECTLVRMAENCTERQGERDALRTQLAAVEKERDEARGEAQSERLALAGSRAANTELAARVAKLEAALEPTAENVAMVAQHIVAPEECLPAFNPGYCARALLAAIRARAGLDDKEGT